MTKSVVAKAPPLSGAKRTDGETRNAAHSVRSDQTHAGQVREKRDDEKMSDANLIDAFKAALPDAMVDSSGKMRRPPEIDASTLKRLYFIRPLMEPCTRTTLSNLDILERTAPNIEFYRTGSGMPPDDRWSDLLNMDLNDAHVVLHEIFTCMKSRYHGGESPFHFDCFRQMQFTTRTLIRYLIDVFKSRPTPFDHSLKIWDLAIVSLTKAQCDNVSDDVWCRDIDRFESAIFDSFKANCQFLKSFEYNAATPRPVTITDFAKLQTTAESCKHGAESANRKADALLAVAAETRKTVNRIDKRGKRDNRRRRFTVEQQEQCFRYWGLGRKNATIKHNTTGKVRYEHVFAYYRNELEALGIKDNDDFESALGARSDRIRRMRMSQ